MPTDLRSCGKNAFEHGWSSEPTAEVGDIDVLYWWLCRSCPARVLHDPETEDGFPDEPVVVFPASCFEAPGPCGCPRTIKGEAVHLDGCIGEVFSERHVNDTEPPTVRESCLPAGPEAR